MRDLFGRSQWLIGARPGNQTLDLFDEDLCGELAYQRPDSQHSFVQPNRVDRWNGLRSNFHDPIFASYCCPISDRNNSR